MKRFDQEAIMGRMLNNLKSQDQWNNLQEDGATYQLIETIAESLAEQARYGEYLLKELKWDTSQNYSSIKHMARLVGKKLDRKHSAVGTIIVSHTDPEGIPRYAYLGVNNFSIDSESNYDNLELDEDLTEDSYLEALVPWIGINSYSVNKGAIFTTNNGIQFIAAEKKTIQTTSFFWKNVIESNSSLNTFYAQGGWNNYKYLIVPVIQGIEKDVLLGTSDNTAGQSFLLSTLDVEAADNYYTKQFCYCTINGETWTEVQHLQTAESTDKVFEIEILDDLSGTQIKFGDSICGAIPDKDAEIRFHYIETLGSEGNITELYQFNNIFSGYELPETTNYVDLSIGCQNMWPIIGGKDLESLSEFKENAETAYAKNYKILHTFSELKDSINTISPLPLIKVKVSNFYNNVKVNNVDIYENCIGVTGLSTSLRPLNTTEKSLFETIVNNELNDQILSNKKIKYLPPEITEIDSAIEIELKTNIQDEQTFLTGLSDFLQKKLGKANLETIDKYMQSDIIRQSLNYSENIGSIQATNLFTIENSSLDYGVNSQQTNVFLFTFEIPTLNMNNYGKEGYLDKSLADGNEIPYIFNLNINGNKFTFVVKETTSSLYTVNYFTSNFDETALSIPYYKTIEGDSKYTIYKLLREKHSFTSRELSSINNLVVDSNSSFNTINFYISRSNTSEIFYLLLDEASLASYLGFTETPSTDKIYTRLKTSIDNGFSRFTVSFEPFDKTVAGNWNNILYYNNIDVTLES